MKRIQVIRIATLAVVIMGLVKTASAWDIRLGTESMVTVSDNISRDLIGQEKTGYMLTMEGELQISGELSPGSTVDLSMGAGWETLVNGQAVDADTYRLRLNARFPWTKTGFIEGSGSSSNETVIPEFNDVRQERVRTKISEAGLVIGKRSTPAYSWSVDLAGRTEFRFDRDLEEARVDLSMEKTIDQRRSLAAVGGLVTGTEDVEGNSWDGSSLDLTLARRVNRSILTEYWLEWEKLQVERLEGTEELSDRFSPVYHHQRRLKRGWTLLYDIGLDGIRTPDSEREWLPRAMFGIRGDLAPTTSAYVDLSTTSSIWDPLNPQIIMTTDSVLDTSLTWRISRSHSLTPRFRYLHSLLTEEGDTERTDRTTIAELGAQWQLAMDWSFEINAVMENQDSTLEAYGRSENRLEFRLAGIFF